MHTMQVFVISTLLNVLFATLYVVEQVVRTLPKVCLLCVIPSLLRGMTH